MLKLLKRFSRLDYFIIAILVAFVVGQVYFDVTLPGYTADIVNEMTRAGATSGSILAIGLVMLLFALGSMTCTIIVGYIAAHLASKFARNLRRSMFKKVQSFSFEETNKFSTASLITRSTNDIQQVQTAVIMILRLAISAPITAVWAIIKINASSGSLTLATAIWVVILVVFLAVVFLLVLPKFSLIQKLTDKINGVTRENLTGLRVVKAYNAEQYQQNKFENVNESITKLGLHTNRILGLMQPVMMLVMNGLMLTIYWLGASLINMKVLNIGTMLAFSSLTMQVLMAFMMLLMLFIMVPRAAISAKRINEVLLSPVTVTNPANALPFDKPKMVEFKNVSFKYPGAQHYVLKNISFTAKAGETVAIIGSTGSGKSTLINLVPRFYDATEGEVLVNNVNVKNLTQANLRGIIGYVPQKGVLFSGSVKSNIGFASHEYDMQTIEKSAEIAHAHEFIKDMENGYESQISQGGKNVSGGQKQRLSIARAVANNPEIFIFDDSFSALDYKTDKHVRQNLKNHHQNVITLVVAQRIGTILDANKIIVLHEGEMIGMGTHQQLIKDCTVYKEIALSQLSAKELGL